MLVNNVYLTNAGVGQPEAARKPAEAGTSPEEASPPQDASLHIPSPELVRLLALLRETAEVRAERIQQVIRQLADGAYLTQTAAEQTAQAILDARE